MFPSGFGTEWPRGRCRLRGPAPASCSHSGLLGDFARARESVEIPWEEETLRLWEKLRQARAGLIRNRASPARYRARELCPTTHLARCVLTSPSRVCTRERCVRPPRSVSSFVCGPIHARAWSMCVLYRAVAVSVELCSLPRRNLRLGVLGRRVLACDLPGPEGLICSTCRPCPSFRSPQPPQSSVLLRSRLSAAS